MYCEAVQNMGAAGLVLKDRYAMLCELGNMFLVKPDNLKTLLQEGVLSLLDPKLVYPFIVQRADFKSAQIDLLFPEISSFSRLFD